MAQKRILRFRPKYFYHRNNTAETEICDDANKKHGQHTLVWISANMSAVWTLFNVSEKDPRIAICQNCNALILMKLVHSHSHKCNGTRVATVWTFSHQVIQSFFLFLSYHSASSLVTCQPQCPRFLSDFNVFGRLFLC